MAGGSPLCLAGRLIGFGKETDGILVDCWLVDGSVFFCCKIQTIKLTGFFLAVDWQHGWRLPSLLSWLVVDWLVLATRLTECWLAVGSWVARCFFTAKFRLKNWRFFFLAVYWLHGWRLPSLLSWSVVGWLVLAKRLTECWLAVDWWVARCFLLQNGDKILTFFSAVDWMHGWRLPSLLSWLVVSWLVLAKRLTECWLAVGWWVARCFLL